MQRAARWLVEKDMSVSEVASKSGLNNIANYNRNFIATKNFTLTNIGRIFQIKTYFVVILFFHKQIIFLTKSLYFFILTTYVYYIMCFFW